MKIGYARVSTEDQNLDLQLDHLERDGCTRIFKEKVTGKRDNRPALNKALDALQTGDTLVVWKLDRLGRSLKHLIDVIRKLERRGVGFRSISDGIDTNTPTGKLLFHLVGAIAEFECDQISERTKAGMEAARRRGKLLGRPRRISPPQIELARQLCETEALSRTAVAERFNVGRTTLWRAMSG